jgi:glycosyltransferase involved in cell wall biosynthesis
MKRIRVAHVITRLCQGGAQENTFHSVRLADRDKFDVDLISGPTLGHEGSIEAAVREAGIEVHRESHLVRDPSLLKDPLALQSLTRRFKTNRYDIVHTHTSKAGFLGRIAAHRAGVPGIIHTAHGNIFDGYFSPLKTQVFIWCDRHVARYTDRFIELTPGGIDENLRVGIGTRDRYRVIFSGVDFAPFDLALAQRRITRENFGIRDDEVLIGGVGRLEPVKGFTYFVDAAVEIANVVPNARFMLVGDGSERAAIEAKASALGDRIRLLGRREHVPNLMAAMDVFVLPSLNEGMGRVLLEAGAARVPMIATRVGGVPDLLQGGTLGVLVPPRNSAAIASAVIDLVKDASRREALSERARNEFVPRYSLENMVRQIEALYEEVCREKRIDR